ncbi:MAG: peptidoglycan DD-metalloendopeptidase family protein [Clostridia bacterium]|nr:peptidoglycan DD-metalloendopeptidase family protein [Clostridia bacterium]
MHRNSIWVRIFAIVALVAFLAVSVLTIIPMNVGAKSAESQLKDAQKKQSELKDKINDTKTKITANSKEKQALDAEIAKVQSEIDKLNSQITTSNNKIAAKEQELTVAQQNSQKQYDNYFHRAKMMVEKGSVTYLEVLLNSKSFSDLLSRYSVVKQIVRYDSNRLDELKAIEQQIAAIKNELEAEKSNLVALKTNETEQMNSLAAKRAASQKIIDDLQSDKSSYEKALKEQEQAEANARAEIARLAAQSSSDVASLPKIGSGGMVRPASGPVTSSYGTRIHPVTGKRKTHTGIDYGSPYGSNIVAAAAGKVIVAGYNSGGYGNYVVINHGNGVTTLYGHASSLLVSKGQTVSQGQVIAKVGSTGMSTGPHLHFEVLVNGSHTNPAAYLP